MAASGIYFYFLFKTTAPDGSAFFGIHRSQNITWGTDGNPVNYIGTGPKLQAKVRQFGINRMRVEVLYTDPLYDNCKRRLDSILTPATLQDPRCLNVPLPERNQKISEALSDLPKSAEHKAAIAESMADNKNALGHVKGPEAIAAIAEAVSIHRTGTKWFHRKDTGEEIQLGQDEDVLTGFELGRLPKELKSRFNRNAKVELSDAERARMISD